MIIGIAGHIGAGKDTFGMLLQNKLDAFITSFAEPIRDLCACLGYNWVDRALKEKEKIRHYGCLEEAIQNGIEFCMGGWEDNDKAVFYAFLVEELEPNIVRGKTTFDPDSMMISPRQLMQKIGTAGRKTRASLWTDELLKRCAHHKYAIVTDVRFPEEAAVCDELLYIIRDGYGKQSDHVSESHHATLIQQATHLILNKGPITNLAQAAEAEARRINGK